MTALRSAMTLVHAPRKRWYMHVIDVENTNHLRLLAHKDIHDDPLAVYFNVILNPMMEKWPSYVTQLNGNEIAHYLPEILQKHVNVTPFVVFKFGQARLVNSEIERLIDALLYATTDIDIPIRVVALRSTAQQTQEGVREALQWSLPLAHHGWPSWPSIRLPQLDGNALQYFAKQNGLAWSLDFSEEIIQLAGNWMGMLKFIVEFATRRQMTDEKLLKELQENVWPIEPYFRNLFKDCETYRLRSQVLKDIKDTEGIPREALQDDPQLYQLLDAWGLLERRPQLLMRFINCG